VSVNCRTKVVAEKLSVARRVVQFVRLVEASTREEVRAGKARATEPLLVFVSVRAGAAVKFKLFALTEMFVLMVVGWKV